jgi:hypothetical protein
MSTITIRRPDVAIEEVTETLRQALGPHYHVLPGQRINANPDAGPESDPPDTILIGTGSNRVFRADVAISRHSGQTFLHVRPGGFPGTWPGGLQLINALGIARKVRRVLQAAHGLQ